MKLFSYYSLALLYFLQKNNSVKAARKMLIKLTTLENGGLCRVGTICERKGCKKSVGGAKKRMEGVLANGWTLNTSPPPRNHY